MNRPSRLTHEEIQKPWSEAFGQEGVRSVEKKSETTPKVMKLGKQRWKIALKHT